MADFLFGQPFEQLITNSSQNIYVYNPLYSLNLYKKILLFLPPHAEKEINFMHILNMVIGLTVSNTLPFEFYSYGQTALLIETYLKENRNQGLNNFHSISDEKEIPGAKMIIGRDDFLVVVSPQRENISYSKAYNGLLKRLLKDTGEIGYMIIYPGVGSKN
jgi:hypothetical protein